MQALFEAIRESCSRANWSRGVELSRGGAVMGESDGAQVVLRVATPGEKLGRTVVLVPEDEDWSCDCAGRDDVCVHVAAAVIALKRAREAGAPLPISKVERAKVGYRFTRTPAGLSFDRHLVLPTGEKPLTVSLAALLARKVEGPEVSADAGDLAVEVALGTRRQGVLPRETLRPLLAALGSCGDVTLDGSPIACRAPLAGVVVVLEDQADGFRLHAIQDPSIDEVFENGVVRCDERLHPVGDPPLSARELSELRVGRHITVATLVALVTEELPALRARVPVEVRTTRLPQSERLRPRIDLTAQSSGDGLRILPTIVYGDPPCARVDGELLVHLGGAVPVRDREREKLLQRRLEHELGLVPGHPQQLDGEAALELAEKVRDFAGAEAPPVVAAFRLHDALTPLLELTDERFSVRFTTRAGRQADPLAVLRAFREGRSLVPLLDGGLAPLPPNFLAEHGERIADLLLARSDDGALPTCMLPELGKLCEALDEPKPPSFARLRPLLEGFDGIPEVMLPDDLRAELRPYQRHGVAWLSFLQGAGLGALLADDMGLGKTLQAACVLGPGSLVVAPTSVLANWRAELARFRPGLSVCVYHGANRSFDAAADVTLTSYALLRLDADAFAARSFRTVVLDEAQAIKNPESQVARAAYALRADFRLCLTGTPIENRLEELWSQLHFTNRGLLGGRRDFDARYAQPIAQGVPGVAARLRGRVAPFVLRRRKSEVAPELPPRTERVLLCELSESEQALYDAVRAATREEVVAQLGAGLSTFAALEALLRLRQASCHPALLPGQHAERSTKVDELVRRLEEAATDGHKALVFSQWTSLLDLVEPHLRASKLSFLRLDGSTVDRGAIVDAFQQSDGPPVLLLSLRAGGTGLNLTAADHVFLLDPWWNPAVEDQAADRAHRIGQDRPVFVHRLVSAGTVEEKILELQRKKRAIADVALGDAAKATALTREELLDLLT